MSGSRGHHGARSFATVSSSVMRRGYRATPLPRGLGGAAGRLLRRRGGRRIGGLQADRTVLPVGLDLGDVLARTDEVGERREAQELLVERRVHPLDLRLHGRGVEPLGVVALGMAEL